MRALGNTEQGFTITVTGVLTCTTQYDDDDEKEEEDGDDGNGDEDDDDADGDDGDWEKEDGYLKDFNIMYNAYVTFQICCSRIFL